MKPQTLLSPRVLIALALVIAALLLAGRHEVLSQWLHRSLEWREVRVLEIVEKDTWSLMQESVDGTEASGWLTYRAWSAINRDDASEGYYERAWGVFWLVLALAGWSFIASRMFPGRRSAVILGSLLLLLAGAHWPALALSIQTETLLPTFWLAWLAWLAWYAERPTALVALAGCVLAAVLVRTHMLMAALVPLTAFVLFLLFVLPLDTGGRRLVDRTRRGFWMFFFVTAAVILSAAPAYWRAWQVQPIHVFFKMVSLSARHFVYLVSASPWKSEGTAALFLAVGVIGVGLALRTRLRLVLLWLGAWALFGFLATALRWGNPQAPEYAAPETLGLLAWALPGFILYALVRAAEALASLSPRLLRIAAPALAILVVAGVVLASPGPAPPDNTDWRGLAQFLSEYAGPEDRVLLHGPEFIFYPSQYACVLAPLRGSPLLSGLTRLPSAPPLLNHLISDAPRVWVLRFESVDWPMPVKYEMETRVERVRSYGDVALYQLDPAPFHNLVSSMHTVWRPQVFDVPAVADASLDRVPGREQTLLYLKPGQEVTIPIQVERAGTYNVRIQLSNVAAGTGELIYSLNDVRVHTAAVDEGNVLLPFNRRLYLREGKVDMTLTAGVGGRFLIGRMDIGRDKEGLLPEITHPRNIVYGQSIRFLGYSTSRDVIYPGGGIEISYYWESMRKLHEPLGIVVRCDHLLPEGRFSRFTNDHVFMANLVDVESLVPGEILKETLYLEVPYEQPELPYKVMLGVAAEESMGRFRPDRPISPPRPLVGSFDVESDRLHVGTLEVSRLQKSKYVIERPNPQINALFKFSEPIDFLGYDMFRTPVGESVQFEMVVYFYSRQPVRKHYNVMTTVTTAGSRILVQDTHEPCDGYYPTTIWEKDQRIKDRYTFTVPADQVSNVDLNIALMERFPQEDDQPKQLGRMIQGLRFGVQQREP